MSVVVFVGRVCEVEICEKSGVQTLRSHSMIVGDVDSNRRCLVHCMKTVRNIVYDL